MDEAVFTIGGEGEAGKDVFLLQLRKIFQNLLVTLPRRQLFKHIVNRNP